MKSVEQTADDFNLVRVLDLIDEWRDRYEWSGELAAINANNGSGALVFDEQRIFNALRLMWDDWRNEVLPAIEKALDRLRTSERVEV